MKVLVAKLFISVAMVVTLLFSAGCTSVSTLSETLAQTERSKMNITEVDWQGTKDKQYVVEKWSPKGSYVCKKVRVPKQHVLSPSYCKEWSSNMTLEGHGEWAVPAIPLSQRDEIPYR